MPAKPVVTATWIQNDGDHYYQLWIGDRSWTHDGGPRDEWEPASPSARRIDPTEMAERIEYEGGPRQTVPPKRGRGQPPLDSKPLASITFDALAEQKEFVLAEARAAGQKLSEYMRRLIDARMRQVDGSRKAAAER